MKTITVRDLRRRWPEAEAALQVEDEFLITRDSKPVAKLVRIAEALAKPLSKQGLKSFLQVVIKPRERIARPMRSSSPHQRAETSEFIQCQQA